MERKGKRNFARAKAGIAVYRWTGEPPRRSLSREKSRLSLFRSCETQRVSSCRHITLELIRTKQKGNIDRGNAKSRVEEGGRVREKYHPGHPLDIPRQVGACIRAPTRQIDVYRRGMRLGSSSISGAYSGAGLVAASVARGGGG